MTTPRYHCVREYGWPNDVSCSDAIEQLEAQLDSATTEIQRLAHECARLAHEARWGAVAETENTP